MRVHLINEVFATMKLAYPLFMKNEEVDPAKLFWNQQLGPFKDGEIREALSRVTDKFLARPPTVGQFKQFMRDLRPKKNERLGYGSMEEVQCKVCRSHLKSQRHHDLCIEPPRPEAA